jgi:hypothetical protein
MKWLAVLLPISLASGPAAAADWRYLGLKEANRSLHYIDIADIERKGNRVRFSTLFVDNPPTGGYGITRHEADCRSAKERYLSIESYTAGNLDFTVKPSGNHPLTSKPGGAVAIAVACGKVPMPTETAADPYADAVARIGADRENATR